MRAAPLVAKAIRALAVSPQVMAEVAAACEAAGSREADAAAKLHREWVNDTVVAVGRAWFRAAALDPDATFLAWAVARLGDPFHVTYRAREVSRATHGDETALLFGEVRWHQEVAWAHRMRGSDNDRIAILAETWLTAARRDPAKLFRAIVDIYADEAATDQDYARSSFHLLDADEIRAGKVDDLHWRPLWLRFAERAFGSKLNAMSRAQHAQLATRVREAEWRDRTGRVRRRVADGLRARRPSLVVGVMQQAVQAGLSSDDLVQAEDAFVRSVENGDTDLAATPLAPWKAFAATLGPWAGRADPPSPEEAARRIEAIEQMPPTWASTLPEDVRSLRATDRARLVAWFDAVARDGTRTPPADPAVDYGMWLVEDAAA